jgi:hypothetical protein
MNQQSTQWRCLDEWGPFARLNRQMQFLRKYWYAIAIVPFAVIVLVGLRVSGDSPRRFWDIPIAISLAWGLFVAIYALILTVRTLSIRCPRCGWRFGLADQCGSCGFPRRSVSCQSDGQLL